MCEGISLDLKPRAWQPRGKFLSQVTKKCWHLKQSTFSGFMSQEKAWAQRAWGIGHRTKQENRPKNQAMILKRKMVIMITAIISLPIVPAKKPTKVPTPLLRDA